MSPKEDGDPGEGVLDVLTLLSSGGITVTVGGCPLLSIDSRGKEVNLEVQGVRKAGLRLSDLMKMEEQDTHLLRGAESLARRLSRLGWRLTLYDTGSRLLSVGSGESSLTGYVGLSPLKLRRLLDALI